MSLLVLVFLCAAPLADNAPNQRLRETEARLAILDSVWRDVRVNAEDLATIKISPEDDLRLLLVMRDAESAAAALVASMTGIPEGDVTKQRAVLMRLHSLVEVANREGAIRAMALASATSLPAPRPKPLATSWRSTEGFQNTRWGMTREEVKRSFDDAAPGMGASGRLALEARATIAGIPALLTFKFLQDRLTKVEVVFVVPAGSPNAAFRGLKSTLAKKYGRYEEYERLGDPTAEWTTEKSVVTLQSGLRLWLQYESRELHRVLEDLPAGAEDDL